MIQSTNQLLVEYQIYPQYLGKFITGEIPIAGEKYLIHPNSVASRIP